LIRLRQALREAGALLLMAAALGFIYTAATEKGLFARSAVRKVTVSTGNQAPPMISVDEAWSYYKAGTTVFVDARHDFDFKLGHIKGAINIPLKDYDLRKSALDSIAHDRVVVAYCDGAECNSSIELSVKLMKEGYANVKIFFGGWRDWEGANLPIEKSP
jgi:rhodanese-related sulfurtransferase